MASISLKYKSKQGSLTALGDVDPGAMIPIATTTLTTTTATVTFSSIPQEYEHLQIRITARDSRTTANGDEVRFTFNSDTSSNYALHELSGNGSSASANAGANLAFIGINRIAADGATASIFGTIIMDILDYSNTNKFKTVRALGGADWNGSGEIYFSSGLWRSTSAISSITMIGGNNNNFKQYSSFALYGIKRAGA